MESSIRTGIFCIVAYHKAVQFVSERMSLVRCRIIVQNAHTQTEDKSEDSKYSSYEKSDRYSITSLTDTKKCCYILTHNCKQNKFPSRGLGIKVYVKIVMTMEIEESNLLHKICHV